jgi:hypothetical protein
MLERFEMALKVACLVLGALVLIQCSRFLIRRDALAHLTIPALPTLPADAEAQQPGGKATNSIPRNESQRPSMNVPPATNARVDRITQSEILGSIIRPLPMALLGIAGQDAFLRAPNGQTGLIK